jgi:hypothetical protein
MPASGHDGWHPPGGTLMKWLRRWSALKPSTMPGLNPFPSANMSSYHQVQLIYGNAIILCTSVLTNKFFWTENWLKDSSPPLQEILPS